LVESLTRGPGGVTKAAAGRLLYDTSGMEAVLGSEEADTASILEGTQLCCTHQLRDMLHCLGGVPLLLPLIANLGMPRPSHLKALD
jgi:Domain of unknown function (DUF4704)